MKALRWQDRVAIPGQSVSAAISPVPAIRDRIRLTPGFLCHADLITIALDGWSFSGSSPVSFQSVDRFISQMALQNAIAAFDLLHQNTLYFITI